MGKSELMLLCIDNFFHRSVRICKEDCINATNEQSSLDNSWSIGQSLLNGQPISARYILFKLPVNDKVSVVRHNWSAFFGGLAKLTTATFCSWN
ncbi:hypothetical protein GCK72_009858 [Caenorhabditis remanei]|uniref:Uncharacterized protein n=1 Tax=Caenorhabditis remanei TaxID=31234 RepID=A0A6A5H571_CAERE|nr:hypothetical protein GCK72_009858 [Caenorhabditis remanei]KAF1761602.1 hypothetical protein GCK72_009858 [Caenorhabditis remanei]